MRKILTAATLAAALPQAASALPLVDFYAGGYYWDQAYSGEFSGLNNTVDVDKDLNIDKAGQNVFYAAFEHPVPVLPNFKLKQTAMSSSGSDGSVDSFSFGGSSINFPVSDIETDVDLSHTDLTLYWGLPLPLVTIDFGLTFRQFDGTVSMQSDTASTKLKSDVDYMVPMGYAKVGVDIPLTGLSVGGDVNYIGIKSSGVTDFDLNLTYVLPVIPVLDVGLTAGYRSFSVKVDPTDFDGSEDDLAVDATVAGPYFGLSLHL